MRSIQMITPGSWFRGLIALLCLLFLAGPAWSAKPAPPPTGTGTLTGKVTIAGTRTAIIGATVKAVGTAGSYTATADAKGVYKMTPLPGDYQVTASATGYTSQTFNATIKAGITTTVNFSLSAATVTGGTLTGTVRSATTGAVLAGAQVATGSGGYSALTNSLGVYQLSVAAGSYQLTASATGYQSATLAASVVAGATTTNDFNLQPLSTTLSITSLSATPSSFNEGATSTVSLSAVIAGTPTSYAWSQLSGPKVPLSAISATSASADVSALAVAAEAELVFRLSVSGTNGPVTKDVAVLVRPVDIAPVFGPNVQIGGSTTAVGRFTYGGAPWCVFNIGTILKATPVGMTKGALYSLALPGNVQDLKVFTYNGGTYAVAALGGAGVALIDLTNPAAMTLVNVAPVNYLLENVTFTETGGAILYGNSFASSASPIVCVETDGISLYLGNHEFGIHKTALLNLFADVREADGTLKIDSEVATVQYAGEHAWGGPISLRLFGGKLFSGLGMQGMGIFDPATLQQVGRYNLYTDEARTEDYFGAMAVTQAVAKDASGAPFVDAFTGLPDYRQVNYEITVIMKGTGAGEPTPWADLERNGKWFYEALDVDVALQGSRTIAYIASSLGGVVAVDVTGYATATATSFLNGRYLGFFPAVPANGPYDTLSSPASLLPYEGAGMLKEAGMGTVRVRGDQLFLTDHFAGLVILSGAANPEFTWRGSNPPYNNNTDGIADNNVPVFEDITSYDMAPYDTSDNESLPRAFYQAPCQLATRELKGHGYSLAVMDSINLTSAGQVDVLECSSGGGFVFVDVKSLSAPLMADRFAIVVYFPTTDEIGAAPDGTPTQTITLGHTDSIAASRDYIYISDGPHGVSAWRITDAAGYPIDNIHLVGNTLQDEYPQTVNGELIYPASHTVRNIIDPSGQYTWALCVGNGLRRVAISAVETGVGTAGAPLLMKLHNTDNFEHNADWGVVKALNYQDHAYDVEFLGNLAFVADGSNGLTVYDTSKDPTRAGSGFFVANVGYNKGSPLLGTTSGVELWSNPADGQRYAVIASGPVGIGVVNISNVNAMAIVKVFEPIKYENDELGSADGQAIDVEVIGDKAYITYDSFGVLCYSMADLIAPVPAGVSPTELFKKATTGSILYDYRPAAQGRFKLQYVPGYEEVDGGAVKMDYTLLGGKLHLYVAFGAAGVVKVDYTDPTTPVLVDLVDTASEAVGVTIAHGRLFVADHGGGLVYFK
ncbi:MAG: carboxypeptidase regulatory-like domain-containing protein [Desulfuromonadales bacterium]|nr:carboxypeptidase regulatory-like domain-containing protein [Desulfuromonadales bacterium]